MATLLADAIEAFYTSRKARGLSLRTLEGNRTSLSHLREFLEKRGISKITDVKPRDLVTYQNLLMVTHGAHGRPLCLTSQAQYLMAARGLFGFLVKTELLLINPAQQLELPRWQRRPPEFVLDDASVRRLLEAPSVKTVLGVRDRAMLEVLYSTGVRVSELIGLNTFEIDRIGGELLVRRGKGRKSRRIPVGTVACSWVGRYLEEARPKLIRGVSEAALFVSQWGRRLDRANVARIVRTYAHQAGIVGRVTPHVMRHTFATHMLRGGADLRHLQEMLGHVRLSTTQIYTHVDISDLKAVHRRCHPRGRE